MTVVIDEQLRAVPGDTVAAKWRVRIDEATQDRRRYEPTWQSSRAFVAGKHHLKWSRRERRLVLPPAKRGVERYSVEEIGQYRLTAVGELSHDDTFPSLIFRNTDVTTEEFTKQANDALTYALQEEAKAEEIALDLKFVIVDVGTAAIRCRYDHDFGGVFGYTERDRGPGRLPGYDTVRDGRVRLEIGAPENLLVPPGVEYQRDFPWEIWVRPCLIKDLRDEYGEKADGLQEESLASLQNTGGYDSASYRDGEVDGDSGAPGRLRDHALVYTCYERPSKDKPEGEMVVLAGSKELRPLTAPAELPYAGPDGVRRSGITYFHYQRVPGRFWGRSLTDVLKDPQRGVDRARSQVKTTIDRGQPYVIIGKGSMSFEDKTGAPMEIYEIEPGGVEPKPVSGMPPGNWMQAEVDSCREDMSRASGFRDVSLGDNPTNVITYSQLSLLREQDATKRVPLQMRFRLGMAEVVENVVYDIRTKWGSKKQLTIAGDVEGMLQAQVFDATKVPTFFKVEIPTGSPKPVTQGAKLQMIQDVANFSTQARSPLPVAWFIASLKAGELLDLPSDPAESQRDLARMENTLLVKGLEVEVGEYDNNQVHLVEHRHAEDLARASGNEAAVAAINAHCIAHIQQEQAQAALQARAAEAQMQAQQPPEDGAAGALAVPPPEPPLSPAPLAGTPQ